MSSSSKNKKSKKSESDKKNSRSILKFIKSQKPIIVIPLLIILLAIIIVFINKFKSAVETKNTSMFRVPHEVAKQLKVASQSATIRVPILLYHYIEYIKDKKDTIRQSLDINPDVFEQQIKTLHDNGFTFMTISQLSDVIDNKASLPEKPVILTFDDGHWDLYTDVLPILQKYQAKATAYIISGFIGRSDFLTSDQLQKVIQSGLVEIGAHTVDHIALAKKLLPIVQYEVNTSKQQLEDAYHIKVVSFAYPSGFFDNQSIKAVKDAGYTTAVSTIPGIEQSGNNKYFLYRLRPGYKTGDALLKFFQQEKFKPW